MRPASGLPSGTAGQMKTAPSTRSGCSAASSSARCAPSESDTSTARSVAVASITASASAANSALLVAARRTVRATVAAPVEREHPAVPREVGDLHLPVARVDDRPRRQQEHGRLARAVDLVVEPHAVARDVARRVRVARPRLLARGSGQLDSHRSIQSRSSRVPRVDAAQALDDDAEVEGHHERDERLERQLDPQLAMRRFERLGQHDSPLRVHAREALAEIVVVPGERLQLEPHLLVRDVLADQVAHRRPPLLHERQVGRRRARRWRSISRSVNRSSVRTSRFSFEPK